MTEAETMLGYTKIVAPFDGVVTHKFADVGDLATPGRPLIELDDPQLIRLEADVPEALINRVQLGSTLRVGAALEGREIAAAVSEIAPVADPSSRTFNVTLDLPANAGLRAGQFARVAIPIGETRALRVPALALLFAFTFGLCVGRGVSLALDGKPNRYLTVFWGLEAAGAAAALVVLVSW